MIVASIESQSAARGSLCVCGIDSQSRNAGALAEKTLQP